MSCSAVIDTACSKTVAGKEWFNNYTKMLDDTSLNKIDLFQSHTPFKFDAARKIMSEKREIILVKLVETECKFDVDTVNAKIPLLINKSSLKESRYCYCFTKRQSNHV